MMDIQQPTSGYEEELRLTARLAIWTLLWTGSLALAKYGPSHLWEGQLLSWIVIAINIGIGVGLILAYARYLRGIDELARKIQQDALAIALGVGWVGGFAYVVADAAGLITFNVNVAMFPVVVYIVAVAAGYLRYR